MCLQGTDGEGTRRASRTRPRAYACICMHAHARICAHAQACICIHAHACVGMHAHACRRRVAKHFQQVEHMHADARSPHAGPGPGVRGKRGRPVQSCFGGGEKAAFEGPPTPTIAICSRVLAGCMRFQCPFGPFLRFCCYLRFVRIALHSLFLLLLSLLLSSFHHH